MSNNHKVTCAYCRRRRDPDLIVRMSRSGGGNYRRGGRQYTGNYCLACVEHVAQWLPTRDGEVDRTMTHDRIGAGSIVDAIANFIERDLSDLDEARWRKMWVPDGRWESFDDYFPKLRRAVETSLARRAKHRAEEAERWKKRREENGQS